MERGRLGTARVGVFTVLPEEFQAVCPVFGAETFTEGYAADRAIRPNVVVCRSPDRFNGPAQGTASALVEDFRPEVIIVVGIAGGIHGRDGVQLGDVVVASYIHYAPRKLTPGGDLPRPYAYDHPSARLRKRYVDPVQYQAQWVNDLAYERPAEGTPKALVGPIISAETIMGNPIHGEQQWVLSAYTDAVAVETESAGVARAVHEARGDVDYNPQLLVVRGISDFVRTDEQVSDLNQAERDAWKPYAAAVAAAFAARVSQLILASPDRRVDLREVENT